MKASREVTRRGIAPEPGSFAADPGTDELGRLDGFEAVVRRSSAREGIEDSHAVPRPQFAGRYVTALDRQNLVVGREVQLAPGASPHPEHLVSPGREHAAHVMSTAGCDNHTRRFPGQGAA